MAVAVEVMVVIDIVLFNDSGENYTGVWLRWR